CQQYSKSPPTF
nr:immunoglobulin light chain junction region [Macaca mulatta]